MLQLWFIANTLLGDIKVDVGGLGAGLNVIVSITAGVAWVGKNQKISVFTAKVLLVALIYMMFSYYVAIAGPCTDKFLKFAATAPVLFLLILIGLEVGRKASNEDWLKLQESATLVLLVAFASLIVEMLLPGLFPNHRGQSSFQFSGLYTEPSHVAYSLFPCAAILLVSESKQLRRKGMLALLGLILLSRSSTLIGLIVAWILYRFFVQRKLGSGLYMGIGLSLVVGFAAVVDYDMFLAPTINRIVGVAAVEDTTTVSSLVYVQGWQDAWINLLRSNGLGLGFNMMGCSPLPESPVRQILGVQEMGGDALNAEDGSFVFSKLVSEAGAIGVLFFVLLVRLWIKFEKSNNKEYSGVKSPVAGLQTALIFSFIVCALLRSSGYFGGITLLCLVAVVGAAKWYKDCQFRDSNAQNGER